MGIFLIFLFSLLLPSFSLAIIKGSESAVSVQSLFTFPSADSDNTMLGFGWFKNGFILEDSSTTCTFDSVYPVSGSVNLNGGTLCLAQDLLFKNIVNVQGWGTVFGHDYLLELCSTITHLPSTADVFDNTIVSINNDVTLTSTLTFNGDCTIVGNGNTLYLNTDGGFYINGNSSLMLRDITIRDIVNGNVLCADDSAQLILDTVKWYQSGHYTFGAGSLKFIDHVGFYGDYKFSYDSAQTSTITSHATWQIFDDMFFCVGRKTSDGTQPLYFEDSNAALRFSNCHLHINENGIMFTRGKLIFDDVVQLDDDSTSTLNGMIIGNGNADDDPSLEFDVGASVLLKSSNLVFNTASSMVVKTGAHKGARLKRYVGSNIYLQKDLTLPSMSLEADSLLIPPIALADGVVLEYEDTLVVLPNAIFDITSARRDTYTYLLNGGDSILLTRGTFPLNIQIEGTGNKIAGNGSISGNVTFLDENAQASFDLQGFIEGTILLNNGTLTLAGDLNMGADAAITGSGTLNMGDKTVHLPFMDLKWTSTLLLMGTGASLDLHAKMTFKSTVTISGDVTINGNGNVLDLCGSGSIFIKDSSTLTLKNIYLKNLKESKITCESDNAKIVIDNSFINLGSDCLFDKGSILFRNKVDIVGTYTFTYESSQTSTIDSSAIVHITDNIKFVIGRHEVSLAEPIAFTDDTSVLHMDNCHMFITCCGAQFTNGTLLCDNDVTMEIDATTTDKGLELGDGSENDTMQVILNAGTSVRTLGGIIVYNIGNPNGFVSHSRTSQIVRSPLSDIYMKTAINLTDLTMRLLDTPQLTTPAQQSIVYSNVGIDLPAVEYIISGQRYTNSSNLLGGDHSIFMIRGTYPLGTLILGTGNIIRGNGAIGGPIIYLSPSADLEWLLNGILIGNITLNGGTVKLGCDMYLARGTKINNGTIDVQSYSLIYGTQDLTISQNNYFDGNAGSVQLRSDVTLDVNWTFSQDCVLDGNGNELTLGSSGNILVEAGSKLRLKNIRIKNITGNNIRCLDDAGNLILDNVRWLQSGDFTYDSGILEYYNRVDMLGTIATTFAYQSMHTSTIYSQSRLKLDSNFTFSYDPIFVASKDLLEFEDDTAVLALRSATLHTTVTGMNLKKGTLQVRGDCHIVAETEEVDIFTMIDEGITFGDRTLASDVIVEVDASSSLHISQGSLIYKNVSSSSLLMLNELSTLHISNGATLRLFEDLPLGLGRLELQVGSQVRHSISGKEVIGSIFLVE